MKRLMKKIVIFLLVFCTCIPSLSIYASPPEIVPMYDHAQSCTTILNITSNGAAYCYGKVLIDYSYSAELTLTLYRSRNKENMTYVTSWTSNSGSSISEEIFVFSGYYYRLYIEAKIYDSHDNLAETITEYSTWEKY